jgi:hypothetical protein
MFFSPFLLSSLLSPLGLNCHNVMGRIFYPSTKQLRIFSISSIGVIPAVAQFHDLLTLSPLTPHLMKYLHYLNVFLYQTLPVPDLSPPSPY